MEKILSVKNLKKSFKDFFALKGITFDVYKKEIFGIIGPDGAGKTTTLRILSGIMDKTEGEVFLLNYSLPEDSEKVKNHIGYMPQKFSLYEDLTIEENVKFFAKIFQIKEDVLNKRLKPLLEMTNLQKYKNRLAGKLSGGMKQKLALLTVLIHRPEVLILDEPTTGVDPVSRREFWEILHKIVLEGVTVILTTPYMDEAELCNRVALIFDGKVIEVGIPYQMKKRLNDKIYKFIPKSKMDIKLTELINYYYFEDVKVTGKEAQVILKNEIYADEIKKIFSDKYYIKKINPTVEDFFITKLRRYKSGKNNNCKKFNQKIW